MISELPMTEKDTVLVQWGPDRQYSLEELVDDVDAAVRAAHAAY